MYFRKESRLTEEKETGTAAPDQIRHIPPTRLSQMPEDVPALTYTSAPLKEEVEICGPVTGCIQAAIDTDDAHLAMKLWDKDAETGYLKCSHRELDPSGTEHRPKHAHTKDEPVEAGKVYEYIFELAPVDNLFKKGHQIEVEFKTMDQQYFDFNEMASLPRLYTSGRVAGPHPLAREVNFDIHVDSEAASWIELPIVNGEKNWVE